MTNNTKKSAFVATGLMLFALFFGAGNLIFPAYIGQQSGQNIFTVMAGFLITGAGLPLLGVIAVGYSGERDLQALGSRVSKWYGLLFAVALYLCIGPLFAIPRTASASFEIAMLPFFNGGLSKEGSKWALLGFTIAFFLFSGWLSISPSKLVDRIGKILTPALLIAIAILVFTAAAKPMGPLSTPQGGYANSAFIKGIIDGYSTMDALASLVFAIIVIDAVRAMGVSENKEVLRLTIYAGLVAAGFLALVYIFIGYMGATSVAGIGLQENGATILSKSAEYYFGAVGKILLAIIMLLACLSTAVGLITACAEYFNRLISKISYKQWVVLFTVVSCAIANVGLDNIIKFSIPALMLLYPLTVVIIVLAFLHPIFKGTRAVYICTIIGTLPIALLDGWRTAYAQLGGTDKTSLVLRIHEQLNTNLYWYDQGLGWVLPAVVGFVIGIIISKLYQPKTI